MRYTYIPIRVGKNKTWYMDVSNVSLSELFDLREKLKGTISYIPLDYAVYERISLMVDPYSRSVKREKLRNKARRLSINKSPENNFKRR